MLQPIRDSFLRGEPIAWNRVHDLPDFVYFDHSAHVNKGVACRECHGRVDQMPLISRQETLFMGWCLACHRHPEGALGPREAVFAPRPRIRTKSVSGSKHTKVSPHPAKWNGFHPQQPSA